MYLLLTIYSGLVGVAWACNLTRQLAPGESYVIQSPGFPGDYSAGTLCSWRFYPRPGNTLRISCDVVNVPRVWGGLCVDWLELSDPSGRSETYCGSGPITAVLPSFRLRLISKIWSWGGRFRCTVVSSQDSTNNIQDNCDCGYTYRPRIVGGVETGVNEFPFMAGIVSAELGRLTCGAAIIGTRHALTAAHCLVNLKPSTTGLLVGDHDLTSGRETNAAQLLKVARLMVHKDYTPQGWINDIGLIETQRRIEPTPRVGPACLPFHRTNSLPGDRVVALGWGTTNYGGSTSDVLRGVELTVRDPTMCATAYPDKFSASGQMCTFSPGKDACQFDSGGPVVYLDPNSNRFLLVGIISYGRGCADEVPSVNTKVAAYLDWIMKNTPEENYCVK